MSKRAASEPAAVGGEEEDLVFEDPFEDEFDSDDAESEDESEGDDAPTGSADVELDSAAASGPEAAAGGSSVDTPSDLASSVAAGSADEDDEAEAAGTRRVWRQGLDTLAEGEELEVSPEAYIMLHALVPHWPCLSFDILPDRLGAARTKFPHTAFIVAGTQADKPANNRICVMKASELSRTQFDDGECVCQHCVAKGGSVYVVLLTAHCHCLLPYT